MSNFTPWISTLKKIRTIQQRILNSLVLHGIYFVGIGLTSLFGRVVRKRFLPLIYKNSSWENGTSTKVVKPSHMY